MSRSTLCKRLFARVLALAVAGGCSPETAGEAGKPSQAHDDDPRGVEAGVDPGPDLPLGVALTEDAYAVSLGPVVTVYQPSPQTLLGAFVNTTSFDVVRDGSLQRRVLLGFSQSADDPSAPSNPALLTSVNAGETFPSTPLARIDSTNLAHLRDGSLLSVRFLSGSAGPRDVVVARSKDGGESWQTSAATFDPGGPLRWLRWHREILELADAAGTLLMPFYGAFEGDAGTRIAVAQSVDGGATWTLRSTIAKATAAESYNEAMVAEVADGSLLAVTRTQTSSGHGNLKYSRSKDQGLTWTPLAELLLPFGTAAPAPRLGVDPVVRLLPDGALVLSSGRPDNWVAVSPDGVGEAWQPAQITYVNYPTQNRHHGSSGYTGLAPVGVDRLVLVGDNCANSWGCPAGESGYTVDGLYRIWRRSVNILTSDLGRIDLSAKLANGAITVSGDFDWTSAAHPEARPSAALDGSTAMWSSAVSALGTAKSASYRVALDQPYDLTRLGLSVGRQPAARARVYAEGGDAGRVLLVDTGAATQRALAYYRFHPPVRARAIEVVVEPAGECFGGLPSACATLNELELYSTVDSFENEVLGAPPRGFAKATMATVAEGGALGSRRALRIRDGSSTRHAVATRAFPATPAATLSMRVKPMVLPGAFLFDLDGQTADGKDVSAYHLAVFSDGSLQRYDGVAQKWMPLAPPGRIPIGAWTSLRVEASATEGKLFADDREVAAVAPSVAGVARLSAVTLASAGTASFGDDVLVDDLLVEPR